MGTSERERIERLAEIFAAEPVGVVVGIGDDAAVLGAVDEPMVWTVDAAVEGTHFRREWLSFEDIGYRSTMAAVSDLAAMGAEAIGVLAALVLPEDVGDAELDALARGQREAVAELGTAVIGGNLARGRELSITTTALGRTARPVLRSGAKVGEALWMVGPVGLAAAGLRLLMEGRTTGTEQPADGGRTADAERPANEEASRACVAAWRRPRARIECAPALRTAASAAIDVSDGLARDVGHLARASGVRAVIEVASLENETLTAVAARLGVPALELALFGGEDYAIVFAAPPDARVPGAVRIGWIEAAAESDPVVAHAPDGSRRPLRTGGFDHFAR